MILNMSGGVPLNFSVTAYASESGLPTSARENAIAVITNTAITSYIFSSEEPAQPTAGMVWIKHSAGGSIEFSATSKNPIMLCPNFAKQYVGGTWVDKTVRIFQDGEWKELAAYLYNNGDQCTALTGGYKTVATGYGEAPGGTPTTLTYGSSSVFIEFKSTTSGTNFGGIWVTKNKIDLTPYTKLCMIGTLKAYSPKYQHAGTSSLCVFRTASTNIVWNEDTVASIGAVVGNSESNLGTKTLTNPVLDVSNVSGEYFIGISGYTQGNSTWSQATIAKLYLE